MVLATQEQCAYRPFSEGLRTLPGPRTWMGRLRAGHALLLFEGWRVTGLSAELLYRELMEPDSVAALESPLPATPEETEASLQQME